MIDRRSTPIRVVVAGFNPACDSGKSARRVWDQPARSGHSWRRQAASQNRYSYRVLARNTVFMRSRSASLASLPNRSTNSRSHAVNSLYSGAL